VEILGVKHLVICGHYGCVGVKAAMESGESRALSPWLNHIRDVYRLHSAELNNIKDEQQRYKRFVELNVQEQCINALKIPEVKQACHDKKLTIHGWAFDIESGRLVDLDFDPDNLPEEIGEIY
jgi:carbonic anhydrase